MPWSQGRGTFPLRTKVQPPVARDLVARTDPLRALASGQRRRLTLVRAPAGWGKSSLVATWSASGEDPRPFAWLSLDPGDNDAVRFFLYAIEALREVQPTVGQQAERVLRAPGISLIDDVLPILINELDDAGVECVLVIEDYHVISSAVVHEAIAFLLDHAPEGLELVLTTRVEPPLPIARLRARGELLEVSTAQLGFSNAEARTLLNEHQGLGLDPADVSRLVERTEGWPAGLYLAALSLRAQTDAHSFIESFAGDDRNIVDYLTTEVLTEQSAEIYDFLLSTSVLERLCPSLCDAVVGGTGSDRLLRQIEESNAFLTALDNKREWYRYHHLFRDLLHNELMVTAPDRAVDAHRRAAEWLHGRGEYSEAIHHTLAAGDLAEAVEMIASSWRPVGFVGGHQTVEGWLAALPREVHRADARLCVASAVTAIGSGRVDEVAPWLELAAHASAAGPFHDGFASGAQAAGCLTTLNNWLIGDLSGCSEAARRATDASREPSTWDAVTYTWWGAATVWLGDTEEGLRRLEAGLDLCWSAQAALEDPSTTGSMPRGGAMAVACLGMLGLTHLMLGDFDRAQERTDAALALSAGSGLDEYWVTTAARTVRAGLLTRAGRLEAAREELDRALEVARRGSGPIENIHAMVASGLAARARGDHDAARVHIGDARSMVLSCTDPGPVVYSLVKKAEGRMPMARGSTGVASPMIADFSEREIDVLRLLGGELSQREIGEALFISFNTVKTHSKSVYRKLGVGQRHDAVARARELDLI